MKNSNKHKIKIAYIIGSYPSLTTTFIDREIEFLKNKIELKVLAIRKKKKHVLISEVQKNIVKKTSYLIPIKWPKLFLCFPYYIFYFNWKFISLLFYLITRPHPSLSKRIKTILHIGEGVYAAFLIKNENYTHLHAHFIDRAAIVAFIVSRLLNIPYSVTAHAADIYVAPVMLYEKIKNAKFVVTCTKYNQKYLENYSKRKIELIYHGVDLKENNEYKKKNNQKHLILSIGQLKEKKGFEYLIKACKILKNNEINFLCQIIGEGPERANLEKLIIDLHLKDHVILKGAMKHEEVMQTYKDASVFVLSSVPTKNSDRDGIPNVLLEAMLNKVPIISTKFSGIPEVVENGVNGLLVDPGDYRSLAKDIATLLENSELRDNFARKGKKIIEDKFDINKNVNQLVQLFNAN